MDRNCGRRHIVSWAVCELLQKIVNEWNLPGSRRVVRVGLGTWCRPRARDDLSPPRFSMLTTGESWTWIFENAEGPALIYSSLEALAVLFALKLLQDKWHLITDHRIFLSFPRGPETGGHGFGLEPSHDDSFPCECRTHGTIHTHDMDGTQGTGGMVTEAWEHRGRWCGQWRSSWFQTSSKCKLRRWDSGVGCITSDFGDGTIRRT